jgi:uncharacterized protein YkwD
MGPFRLSGIVVCVLGLGAWFPTAAAGQSVHEGGSDKVAPAPENETSLDLARVLKRITSATNEYRKQSKLRELKTNEKLTKAAQSFADFMAQTDKYGHTADGRQPWERAAKYGYTYCVFAENIAYQYNSAGFTTLQLASRFVTGWKESPPHRKNMLDPDLEEIGVGVAHSKTTGRYYAVQDFGRPKSSEIVFKITNQTDTPVRYTVDDKAFTLQPRYTQTHERCRPPKLALAKVDEKQTTEQTSKPLQPRNGDAYAIKKDQEGKIKIEEE